MFKAYLWSGRDIEVFCRKVSVDQLGNHRGQSLVQVLVSVAIMGIVMTAMASMLANQSRDNKALGEKLASLELSRAMTQALSSSNICNTLIDPSNLVDSSKLPINDISMINAANPYVINLKSVGSPGGAKIASLANPQVSPTSTSLQIAADGIQLVLTSPTNASLNVKFDQSKLVRGISNLSFPIFLTNNLPANPSTISIAGCGSGSGSLLLNTFKGSYPNGNLSCSGYGTPALQSTVTYLARGTRLSAHIFSHVMTVGPGTGLYYNVAISGPALNLEETVAYIGQDAGPGNIASLGSRMILLNVTPGQNYSFTFRPRCNGTAHVEAGELTIFDYQ